MAEKVKKELTESEVAKGGLGWGMGRPLLSTRFSLFSPLSFCFLFTPSSSREPVQRLGVTGYHTSTPTDHGRG